MTIIRKPTIGSDNPNARRANTKKSIGSGQKMGMSMLKKSELSIVFLGAGLVTLIVFFIFFRPSGGQVPVEANNGKAMALLKERIEALETYAKERGGEKKQPEIEGPAPTLATYHARVARVEAALSVKFDAMTKRLAVAEKKLTKLGNELAAAKKAISTKPWKKAVAPVKETVKPVEPQKKRVEPKETAKSEEKKSVWSKKLVLHTVQKGDTLYSISKKYKTTVDALRKLNKLSKKDSIYIGDNLIVR